MFLYQMKNYMITAVYLLFSIIFLFSCSDQEPVERDYPDAQEIPEIQVIPPKVQDLNVAYKTVPSADGERDLKIDIYYPTNHVYEKSPLIIGFHGGGWIAGDKSQIIFIYFFLFGCI